MKITLDLLREIQKRGWRIEAATEVNVIGQCPVPGCGLRARLTPDGPIPARAVSVPHDSPIASLADAMAVLVERRKALRLTVREVEEGAGLTADHLAKIEVGARQPQIETLALIAAALGFELVLRPADMSARMLRVIAENRAMEGRRGRAFARPPRTLRRALPPPDQVSED